jgi:DNA polymerase
MSWEDPSSRRRAGSSATGKRRLHKRPTERVVYACRPWLRAESDAVGPDVVVALGAAPAQSPLGPDFRVTRQRGQLLADPENLPVVATVHPSAILRIHDLIAKMEEFGHFVSGLSSVAPLLAGSRIAAESN